MGGVSVGNELFYRFFHVFALCELVGKFGKNVGNRSVEHNVGASYIESGAQAAEFEFVACERKRRRAVTVGGVRHKFGD